MDHSKPETAIQLLVARIEELENTLEDISGQIEDIRYAICADDPDAGGNLREAIRDFLDRNY